MYVLHFCSRLPLVFQWNMHIIITDIASCVACKKILSISTSAGHCMPAKSVHVFYCNASGLAHQ